MAPPAARAPASRKALVVVSRYNEAITRRLLDGAREALQAGGFAEDRIDVVWVPGAFELPVVVRRGLASGRYGLAVALATVIRGETPHFQYVAQAATQGLTDAAAESGIPVGFGVLTCETLAQARERAGGTAGNKGQEAAQAALDTARALEVFDDGAAP